MRTGPGDIRDHPEISRGRKFRVFSWTFLMANDQPNRNASSMSNYAPHRRPPLERDQEHKMVAGVCAGLGRHLDIDPVVFRILLTVLTLFGGLGILAYAAAWLLIPATGESTSEAQRLTSGTNVYVAAAVGVLLLLGLMAFVGFVAHSFDTSVPLIFVVAAAVGVVIWHRETTTQQARRPASGNRPNWTDPAYPADPSAPPQAWWQRPVTVHPEPEPEAAGQPEPEQARPEPTQVHRDAAPEKSAAEAPAPAQHVSERPATDQLASELFAAEQPASDQPVSAHPVSVQAVSEQPAAAQPASDQPLAETPIPDTGTANDGPKQIHADKPDADNALAEEPEANESHGTHPAARIEDHLASRIPGRIGNSVGDQAHPDEDRIEDAVEVNTADADTTNVAGVADALESDRHSRSVVSGRDVEGVVDGLDAGGGDHSDGPGTGLDLERNRDGD